MTRRARRWSVLGAVGVLGAAWALGAALDHDGPRWGKASRSDLVVGVEVNGTLAAVESSTVGPPTLQRYWNFKIANMAPEGSEVEAGDVVLAFDTSELEQQLLQQRAEASSAAKKIEQTEQALAVQHRDDRLRLAEAEARRRKAALVVDRPGELAQAAELAEARLDLELAQRETAHLATRLEASRASAESQLAALRAQRDQAERRVAEIEQAITDMTRRAPRAGTVIYVTSWNGEKKKVGDTCWRNENVIELPDLASMRAVGMVDEADAGRVAEDQRVTLRLDAHPDVEFSGRIASIWNTVERESWSNPSKVVRLDIELLETDTRRMRPGMRFRGRVEIERVEDALTVPLQAVFPTPNGPIVYRRGTLGPRAVPVELGQRDGDRVEVRSGLAAGDAVALDDPTAPRSRDS